MEKKTLERKTSAEFPRFDSADFKPQKKGCCQRFCGCLLACFQKSDAGQSTRRHVRLNQRLHSTPKEIKNFDSNYISTTKYTLITFIPKNLYEQFQKAANFYFLLVAIIVSIPGISNIEPYTSILPLVFVLSVTAIKEAIEDYHRYKEDKKQNTREVLVLTKKGWEKTEWQHVVVGDILKILNTEVFPVDLVLLSSSNPKGVCSIVTANLDGETSLKAKQAIPQTATLTEESQLIDIEATIECGRPTIELGEFEGIWYKHGENGFPLTIEQMLLRGARLADTDWVVGVCVYVGEQTKLFLNSNTPRHKRSKMEGVMNEQMYIIFALQFAVCASLAGVSAWWTNENGNQAWYLRYSDQSLSKTILDIGVVNFFGFYVLFSVMVPISLYVSMELVKVMQSFLINWDLAMYDENSDTPAKARTSNLNEELGQIEYIFSDKTGTLTDNNMSFLKCSIRGKPYGVEQKEEETGPKLDESLQHPLMARERTWFAFTDSRLQKDLQAEVEMYNRRSSHSSSPSGSPHGSPMPDESGLEEKSTLRRRKTEREKKTPLSEFPLSSGQGELREFLTCMVVCSTITPHTNPDGGVEFRSPSIDEVALAIAAKKFGVLVQKRESDPHRLILDAPWGKDQVYEILHTIEFTSGRARMSVICRTPEGKVVLYCKGSDAALFPRLDKESKDNHGDIIPNTKSHLEDFSTEGLRTLVLTFRELDNEEYQPWAEKYEKASMEIGNRKEKMEATGEEIEHKLILLGATAIEDKLQQGVPEAIVRLRQAGIKIWVLTGDKQGTAVNIGKSAGLIDKGLIVRYITGNSRDEVEKSLRRILQQYPQASGMPPLEPASPRSESDKESSTAASTVASSGAQQQQMDTIPASRSSSSLPMSSIRPQSNFPISASNGHAEVDGARRKTAWVPFRVQSSIVDDIHGHSAIVVDGATLMFALHPTIRPLLMQVIGHSHSRVVICSRMAPKQKAAVVTFVKHSLPVRTLAIGDGANDVSMIQAAHVGVGIYGKEGRQAVNSSDYAIGQFRFLARLLLVHGRLSYKRNAKLILYSFYKNMAIAWTQLYFAAWSAFSGQEIYDGTLLNTFNVFFTSLPILAVAVFHRELNCEDMMKFPRLYTNGLKDSAFNYVVFWGWLFNSVLHGTAVFFIAYFGLTEMGLWTCSIAAYSYLVIIANVKMFFTTSWNAWIHFFVWGSLVVWVCFGLAYSSALILPYVPDAYYTFYKLWTVPYYYLGLLIVAIWAFLPDFIWVSYRRNFMPDWKHIIQEKRQLEAEKTAPTVPDSDDAYQQQNDLPKAAE